MLPLQARIEEGEPHDGWTTTEAALTRGPVRRPAGGVGTASRDGGRLGEQRVYASHNSIMFSRKSCYFFVRPKKNS